MKIARIAEIAKITRIGNQLLAHTGRFSDPVR
jgi:hypothetical protein